MNNALLGAMCFLASAAAYAQADGLAAPRPGVQVSSELARLTHMLDRRAPGRYLVNGANCQVVDKNTWPGYEGLPSGNLLKCAYQVESCESLEEEAEKSCQGWRKISGPKQAVVVLYEPGSERLARWIIEACRQAGGNQSSCANQLVEAGQGASSWQIPIAGIVFEDMPPRYVHYGYAFRDAITVRAKASCGWINGQPEGERAPTSLENTQCSLPGADAVSASDKIRPLSTTRAELIAWQPLLDKQLPKGKMSEFGSWHFVGNEQALWRQWVRQTLVAASNSDSNPLFIAKAVHMRRQGQF